MSGPREFTEEEITTCLMAVIAWGGNAYAAHRSLQAEGKRTPHQHTLKRWVREYYSERYIELRERYRDQLERQLIHQFEDVTLQAVEVQRRGLERAMEGLETGRDRDPARTAANAAAVADKMARQALAYQGRPTSIREDRNLEEILRGLAARGVIELSEGETDELSEAGAQNGAHSARDAGKQLEAAGARADQARP